MTIPDNVRYYLRATAGWFIDGVEDGDDDERDAIWATLSDDERDLANYLIDAVFGPWL